MMQSAGIVVNDVTVTWRNGHTALRDASFTVPGGSIAALVGVNGSGKSTLFKAIMGFVRLTSGHMGMLRIAKKRDRQIVTDALERVDMVDFRHRQIGELSGGQKKRVFLARAIAQQGDVILLDEPFTGVDVKTEAKIISLLRELRAEGKTMLVSTHNLGSVTTFCDYTVMVKGTVLASGPTDTTFTAENLELAFSGVLRHVTLNGSEESIITDDERPFVAHIDRQRCRGKKDERATGTLQL